MLRNQEWGGMYLAIHKNGSFGKGAGKKFCHLKIMPQPDNYCCFMSVENPGHYVTVLPSGFCGNQHETTTQGVNSQFFIRMDVRTCIYGILCLVPDLHLGGMTGINFMKEIERKQKPQ